MRILIDFALKCMCDDRAGAEVSDAQIGKSVAPPTPQANFQFRAGSDQGEVKVLKTAFFHNLEKS